MSKKPHPIDAYIGARCREAREAKKLRMIDVAEQLGVSHVQIGHYESAQTRFSWETLIKLADIYGKKLSWFFADAPGF